MNGIPRELIEGFMPQSDKAKLRYETREGVTGFSVNKTDATIQVVVGTLVRDQGNLLAEALQDRAVTQSATGTIEAEGTIGEVRKLIPETERESALVNVVNGGLYNVRKEGARLEIDVCEQLPRNLVNGLGSMISKLSAQAAQPVETKRRPNVLEILQIAANLAIAILSLTAIAIMIVYFSQLR